MDIERRVFDSIDAQGDNKITGYAAVFNSLSEDLGGFVEKIERGAFAEAIERDDVRALFNHDSNYVLGRTTSGTLRLSEDDTGLRYEIEPPDTQWARDLRESIKRGDVSQSSFGFVVERDSWDGNVRTLHKVKLFDVSPVTYPAYKATSVSARAMDYAAELQRLEREAIQDAVDSVVTNENGRGRVDVLRKKLTINNLLED